MKIEKSKKLLLIAYTIWAVLAASGIYLLMFYGRIAFLTVLTNYSTGGYRAGMMVDVMNKFYIIVIGILVIITIIASAYHIPKVRNWVELASCVLLCLGFEAAVLTISIGLIQIGEKSFLGSDLSILAFSLTFVGTVIAFIASHFFRKQARPSWHR